MKYSRSLLGAAAAIAMLAAALPASAVTIYALNQTFTAGLVGPFGTVTLTQNGANEVDVSVALAAGFQFVKTGGPHDAFAFNLDTTGYTVSNIVSAVYADSKTGSNPAFGSFTDALTCASCQNGGAGAFTSTLTFAVGKGTGILEKNFVANANGFTFSADVISRLVNPGTTGAVGAGAPVVAIPEPETYALMLAGLGAMAFIARRRKPA